MRLLHALAIALALVLVACGGTTDPAGDAAGLPPADGDAPPTTAGMCVEDEPDCEDMIDPGAGGAAGASCLAGDPDCTDESYGGEDVARPVPLSESPSGAERAGRGATTGATGHVIQHAHLVDEDTLELTVADNPCMLVEDVLVTESPEEVRVLVLAGQDASVDACIEPLVQWSVEIDLEAPLGDRVLLDLAG